MPAEQIETLVVEQIKGALQAPEMIRAVWDEVRRLDPGVAEPAVVLAMRNLGAVWNELFPAERCRLVRLLIKRVQLREDGIDIEWQPVGLSLEFFLRNPLPDDWDEQRQVIAARAN